MTDKEAQFPIVAIGASAGGIEAINAFLNAVPEGSSIAYLVLLHTAAGPESKLAEVFASETRLPVQFAQTGMTIERDNVYISPPGFDMTIRDGALVVTPRDDSVQPQRPVDNLFESVAVDVHGCGICIVLSGTGTNGTAGIRNAKAEGALVIAQDPTTARFPGMPRSAIASGMVDVVLAPEDMPNALLDYVKHPYLKFEQIASVGEGLSDSELTPVLALLKTRTNHDFRGYKKKTILRRVFRRMGLRHIDRIEDYLQILRGEPNEVKALLGDLLINVTGFFRDGPGWDELADRVIRPLVREREPDSAIRVWVPACATGEEAYTVAMVIFECSHEAQKNLDIKIFATDADINALAKARGGLYPASAVAGLSAERLQRFFDQQDDTYRIKKFLRDVVIFAPQDLVADPPFSRLDLVTCRNLLIYLEAPLQKRVISLLHFALREGGYLFLGNAETVSGNDSQFRTVSKKWRIFRRIGATRHDLINFPVAGPARQISLERVEDPTPARLRHRSIDQAQRALIDEFAPPSVLVDQHGRILYYHGDTEPYLKQPAGEPSSDVLTLAREGLRSKLRGGMQEVLKSGRRGRVVARVRRQNGYASVEVSILPVEPDPEREPRMLVTFADLPSHVAPANQNADEIVAPESVITEHDLEEELRSVREELRSTIEQLESANEEMKASNEEITSMNEELQSTNEELETSKEELQSLNEELSTVNSQLQTKVEELEDRTNNLNNLLNSADIATLFLDTRFTIRWFTPAMRSLFDILPTDIGRPVSHFALKFDDGDFLKDAEQVLRSLISHQTEVKSDEGRWYMRRIRPYRTDDNRIDGVVVTFIDITERKTWEEEMRQSRDYAERIIGTLEESLVVLEPDLTVRSANRSFYETFRLQRSDVEGRKLFDIARGEWDMPDLRSVLSTDLPLESRMHQILVEQQFRDLGRRCLSINVRSLEEGRLILLVINDFSDQRDHERRQEVLLAELQHRVKNILASIQAIARMTHQRSTSLDEFWVSFQGRLMALAGTQELLTRAQLEKVSIAELVERELAAQGARGQDYRLDGPELPLTAKAAQNLALALHELTTNATKHGALAQPGGHVEVRWQLNDGRVHFEWIEHGGPTVIEPKRRGFGLELIEKAIPYQLRGKTRMNFMPEGLRCEVDFGMPGNIQSDETRERTPDKPPDSVPATAK